MAEELGAAAGIILGSIGVIATIVIAILQVGQTTRELTVLNATLVESLALVLARFDRIDRALDDIRERQR